MMKALVLFIVPLLTATSALPQTNALLGEHIQIGEHRLFVRKHFHTNTGPTIIFESGGGGTSKDWTAIQNALTNRANTLAYDRAGSGQSEPGPQPRTMTQEVFELHTLLEKIHAPKPYILVGQSLGGLLARLYTDRHPTNVAAAILVDPTHESAILGSMRYGGWTRLREKATGRPIPAPRFQLEPAPAIDPETDFLAEEFQLLHLARRTNAQPLGKRPLIILAAGKRPQPPGTTDADWQKLRAERDLQIQDLINLSQNAQLTIAPTNGHNLHLENPPLVLHAINQLLLSTQKK